MSMVDAPRNFSLPQQHLNRKPLPQRPAQATQPSSNSSNDGNRLSSFQPDNAYLPQHRVQQHQQQQPQHQHGQQPMIHQQEQQQQSNTPVIVLQPDQQSAHSRSRTASSTIFPQVPTTSQPPAQQMSQNTYAAPYQQPRGNQYPSPSRRTLSNATTSTSSTSNYNTHPNAPTRQDSGASSDLQRSTSTSSSNSPTSYVALMRKQKATVWSDRTQHEDPRMVAQQRLAKQRAIREVTGMGAGSRVSTSGSSSITSGVRSKIRHHGAPKAQQYAPGMIHPASGVPLRLSQNEIEEDEDDEESKGGVRQTESGRNSFGSSGQGRVGSLQASQQQAAGGSGSFGTGVSSTMSSGGAVQTDQSPPEQAIVAPSSADETPVPGRFQGGDYFSPPRGELERSGSGGSGSTGRENSFGEVGNLPVRKQTEEEKLDPAELRRRGSVDERTMTMSGYGKLFVANPDVDD